MLYAIINTCDNIQMFGTLFSPWFSMKQWSNYWAVFSPWFSMKQCLNDCNQMLGGKWVQDKKQLPLIVK